MKTLLVALALCAGLSAVHADGVKPRCDERCQAFKRQRDEGYKPKVPQMIDVIAPIKVSGEIQLTICGKYHVEHGRAVCDKVIRRVRHRFDATKTPVVKFSHGAHWFKNASLVELCDERNYTWWGERRVIAPAVEEAAKTSHGTIHGCLRGSECPDYRGKVPS